MSEQEYVYCRRPLAQVVLMAAAGWHVDRPTSASRSRFIALEINVEDRPEQHTETRNLFTAQETSTLSARLDPSTGRYAVATRREPEQPHEKEEVEEENEMETVD